MYAEGQFISKVLSTLKYSSTRVVHIQYNYRWTFLRKQTRLILILATTWIPVPSYSQVRGRHGEFQDRILRTRWDDHQIPHSLKLLYQTYHIRFLNLAYMICMLNLREMFNVTHRCLHNFLNLLYIIKILSAFIA